MMDDDPDFEWDDDKAARNLAQHGVGFAVIRKFEWETCTTFEDRREAYSETRFVSHGVIEDRLHVAVWTVRGSRRRLISLRKANRREARAYMKGQP